MAFQAEIIPFNIRTGGGSQTISHIRYPLMQGKGFIFVCASNSGTNSEIYSFGIDDGITHIGIGNGLTETFGVCLTARGYSSQYSLITEQAQAFFGGAQMRFRAYVSSTAVGSFQITTDLNNTPGAQWYVIVMGGNDVQCKVGYYDVQANPGTVNVGFDPIALITVGTVTGGTGEVAGADSHYGFATPCGNNQCGWGVSASAISPQCRNTQITGRVDSHWDFNTAIGGVASNPRIISSWIPNGFNVSVTSTSAGWSIGYLALGGTGVSANLVTITQPTITGIQNTSIFASSPQLVLFGSTNSPASSVINEHLKITFGAYDGVSNLSQWMGLDNNGGFPYKRDRLSSTTKAITLASATGVSTSTVNAEASCTLSSGIIGLNWNIVDPIQREIRALVLAADSSIDNSCGGGPTIVGEGIYKITLNKTHDTIYNPYPATTNVKIP